MHLFFKCENYQRIGAFKIRGAFHALSRLSDDQVRNGVVTHSSGTPFPSPLPHMRANLRLRLPGNHAQALALAARTRGVRAYIVMPTISTPSKIAATKGYGAAVIFSGSTSEEREAVVESVMARTGAVLVPPYDHADIILGQGTMALEMEEQFAELVERRPALSVHDGGVDASRRPSRTPGPRAEGEGVERRRHHPPRLDALVAPCGGGGMLAGVATYLSGTGTRVFGAEPSHQAADDCRRGLAASPPARITSVKSLTVADGLRTPVGDIPWTVISDREKVQGVYAVSDEQIKAAMRLVLERMKVVVEPSAVVGLAVALWDEGFRGLVEREGGAEGWDVGVVLSGGNTTVEALAGLFGGGAEGRGEDGGKSEFGRKREEGTVGMRGEGVRQVENVAG